MKFDDLYKSIINEADEWGEQRERVEGSFQNDAWQEEKAKEVKETEPADDTVSKFPELSDENKNLLNTLNKALAKGAKFTSFMYKTNGTADVKKGAPANGPTKIYKVNLGISYSNIKAHNKTVIEGYEPKDDWQRIAKEEMIVSLSKPFVPEDGGTNVYVSLGKGIRYNTEKKCLNILGQVTGKAEVVADGQEKPKELPPFKLSVNNDGSPRGGDKAYLAKAKKEINFALKDSLRGGLTSYDLDLNKIAGIKVSGDMIEFHADGKQDMRA